MKPKTTAYLLTGVVILLAALAAFAMYSRYLGKPWTRDGQVRELEFDAASGRLLKDEEDD